VTDPQVLQGAKIGAAAVNAAGGIDGRPVVIDFCDDQYSPQEAGVCATKLLTTNHDLMIVGEDGTQEAAETGALAANHTISFGNFGSSLAAIQDPNNFLLDPLNVGSWVLQDMLPANTNGIAYVTADAAIAITSAQDLKAFIPKNIPFHVITIPLTATSFNTTCLQVKNTGANTVDFESNPNQAGAFIQTCIQEGVNATWVTSSVQATSEYIKTIDSIKQPNVIDMTYSGAALAAFQSDINKYGASVGGITEQYTDPAVNAWLAVKLVPSLVAGAGSVNATAIKNWLDQQTAFSTDGATPPIDFAATPIAQLPRIKDICAYKGTIQNGMLVQTGGPYCAKA
jgi:ABC-type branched-subunit amino acid transport system substrate-binding protein